MSAGSVGSQFALNSAGSVSAAASIHRLCDVARSAGSTELWVYTDSNDAVARIFYMSLGFRVLGPASHCAPGKTMNDSDIVLNLQLDFS